MLILISGICGFVGSTLAKTIREQAPDWKVVGFDNFSRSGSFLNKEVLEGLGIKVFHADLRQPDDLAMLPNPDWVIDAAASTSVLAGVDGHSSSRQLLEINLMGTVNLLELAKRSHAGFILLSTSRVYSIKDLLSLKLDVKDQAFSLAKNQDLPTGVTTLGISEDFATTAPISLYGSTKLASELLALEYGLSFNFPVWIDRCGVLAGAGQFARADQGIFSFWINSHATKAPLKYIGFEGRGYQVRDCFHPRDLFTLIKTQIEDTDKNRERIFNAAGGATNAMSLKQLDDWCVQRFGAHPVVSDQSSRPFDIPWMIMDSSKAKNIFGWQPQITLPEILDEMAEHAIAHPDWLKITSI